MDQVFFPLFNLKVNINPISFSLFGREIRWYGIILSIAFLVGIYVCIYLTKYSEIDKDDIYDIVIFIIPSAIVGARIYYVLFKIKYYANNPNEIFKIWHGGLAIYGGIIMSIIVGILYSKYKKINFFKIADNIIPGLIIGQAIGRWGNFFNVEAYGYQTRMPWRMEIKDYVTGKVIGVHPTFLYESILTTILFLVIFNYFKHKKFDGEILSIYMIFYGIIRFFVEAFRSDSLYFLNMKISQIISVVFIVLGIYTHKILKKAA